MPATADRLRAIENSFSTGSTERYRHWANGNFVFTEGLKTVADVAGAYWLIDILASEGYEQCHQCRTSADDPGVNASFVLTVDEGQQAARLEMEFAYPFHERTWSREIGFTDFPPGRWVFSLEWDALVAFPKTVLVGLLMAEH